jgi:hypothetical protein
VPARCRPGWSAAFYRFLEQIGEPIADAERAVRVDLAHVERLERKEAAERDQHVWDDLPPPADPHRTPYDAPSERRIDRLPTRRAAAAACHAFELLPLPELEHVAAEKS